MQYAGIIAVGSALGIWFSVCVLCEIMSNVLCRCDGFTGDGDQLNRNNDHKQKDKQNNESKINCQRLHSDHRTDNETHQFCAIEL